MRVIAGEFRSRTLLAPNTDKTRPTTDRARESLFNVLANMMEFDDALILDVFAGSGALGIEALSRGAKHATFVENDRVALDALQRNVNALQIAERCTVVRSDAYSYARSVRQAFDLILSDAPYSDERARTELPVLLSAALRVNGLFVIEHRSRDRVGAPDGLEAVRELKAGEAGFTILTQKA